MPAMPSTFNPRGDRQAREREYEAARRKSAPWRGWYSLPLWRKGIRPAQLAAEPLCRRCKAVGLTVLATEVNHVVPHRGDWQKFIAGPFESLCKPCHSGPAQRDDLRPRR